MNFQKIDHYMCLALQEASEAFAKDEVPVGAVIVTDKGEAISVAHNQKEKDNLVTAHAEILAIQKAATLLQGWRLENCDLYVTLEPCPMCLSAISQSRIRNVYFGAYDIKGGSLSLGYNMHKDERLNHSFNIYGGFRHLECSKIVSDFFRQKRGRHNS